MRRSILIGGTSSGCGKTTVTLAILKALKERQLKIDAYKCGPDYIDPMYQRRLLGIDTGNLDPFFLEADELKATVERGYFKSDITVIEGVMGYYDGYGSEGKASTYDVAKAVNAAVILVINGRGMCTTAGALIKGIKEYRPDSNIVGVIFNNISGGYYELLKEVAIREGVRPLGYIPNCEMVSIGSRHLGLITADEIKDIEDRLEKLGELAERYLDIDGIINLTGECLNIDVNLGLAEEGQSENKIVTLEETDMVFDEAPVLAVARDEAFCFIYNENISLFKEKGIVIKYFSPIHDKELPEGISGIYLPGGYPELYLDKLSENIQMLAAVKEAAKSGMPIIAECGGFMYLHELVEGRSLVGVIKGEARRQSRLVRFGYTTITAKADNLLLEAGESIRAHEFHYYESDESGDACIGVKASNGMEYECIHASDSMFAGYPHLFLPAAPKMVDRLVEAMRKYK